MIRFRAGKRHGAGSTPGSYSETTRPSLADPPRELGVRGRVVAVDPAAEDGDGSSAGLERAAMRLAVDPARHPAHDDETGGRELARERARDGAPVRRSTRARRRWRRRARRGARRPPHPRRKSCGGGSWIAASSDGNAASRRRMQRISVMRPEGLPACDTRAPRRREPARRVGARRARRSCARRARRARVRDPRAAAGRPRSTAAPTRPPFGAARRLRSRSRAVENACAHGGRRLGRRCGELRRARPWHRDGEIEAIEQRARELLAIRREPLRRARALDGRIAARAARAHVHRPDELEASREERVAPDARDRDHAVLERLPQRLENGARELGQLVEEQHAAMGERHLARSRARTAADDRRRGRSVVRRAKRRHRTRARVPGGSRPATEWIRVTSSASARVSGGRIPGKPAREHRLAGARRPHEQEVVRAGGGDLERTAGALLSAHVREIGCERARRSSLRRAARTTGRRSRRGSTRRPRRDGGPGTGSMPASAASGADSAAQTTSRADRHGALPRRRRACPRPGGSARRARAHRPPRARRAAPVEAACVAPSTASEIGRSKPDPSLRSAAGARLTVIRRLSGHSSDGRDDAAPHAVLRLLARTVGETDDREARDPRLEMRLDLDLPRLEADERMGDRASEHPRHGRHWGRPNGQAPVPISLRESYEDGV